MGPLWIKLPEGWQTGQIKNAATVTLGKMLQSKDSGSDVRAPYMRAANVQPDGVLALDDVNEMWFNDAEMEQLSIRAGDVVVVEGGQGGFGRAAYVDEDLPGWGFQNSINRLRPIGDFDGRFISFYLIALRASGFIRAYCNVVSMPHLTAEKLARIPIPLPPLQEQRAIANYLDRETARIDELIEEQQRLIALLRERRESVITRAVTRGLNPGVPTIDTGVHTLDHVPQHWQILRIKNVGRALIGLTYTPEDIVDGRDGGTLVLRAGNIQDGKLSLEDSVYVSATIPADLRLKAEDIVICARNGSPSLIGKNSMVTEAVVGQTWGAFMVVLRSPINGYLRWVLNSQIFRSQTGLFSTSTINQLTSATLHNLRFALPPIDEQRRINAYLDEQTAKIDTLIAETERFLELARERRVTLITSAVTGRISLREMA